MLKSGVLAVGWLLPKVASRTSRHTKGYDKRLPDQIVEMQDLLFEVLYFSKATSLHWATLVQGFEPRPPLVLAELPPLLLLRLSILSAGPALDWASLQSTRDSNFLFPQSPS